MMELVVDKSLLNDSLASLKYLLPEVILFLGAFITLLIGSFGKNTSKKFLLAILLISISLSAWVCYSYLPLPEKIWLFQGQIILDGVGIWIKLLIMFSGAIVSLQYYWQKNHAGGNAEFYFLVLCLLAGACLLATSHHLLSMFLSLELISLASYALVAFKKEAFSIEAALKYFLFGATTTAVFVFGISLLYGFTGSLDLHGFDFNKGLLMATDAQLLFIACFLVFAALLFKVSIFPFHIWTPDVYQGASYPVLSLLATVPKVAGIMALSRLYFAFQKVSLAFEGATVNLGQILAILALASMILGTFTALRQIHFKRMMAYSSIAFAGFLLAAVLQVPKGGQDIFLLFITTYAILNLGVFALGQYYFEHFQAEIQGDFYGLFKKKALAGSLLVLLMVGLTGLPPTLGFSSKLLLFTGLFQSYQGQGETYFLWLTVAGIFLTVVSLYFYLKFPYAMIFKKIGKGHKEKTAPESGLIWLALLCTILILVFFFRLDWLMDKINSLPFAY